MYLNSDTFAMYLDKLQLHLKNWHVSRYMYIDIRWKKVSRYNVSRYILDTMYLDTM